MFFFEQCLANIKHQRLSLTNHNGTTTTTMVLLGGKRSLYDDFSYSHAVVHHSAHGNAYFLPWRSFSFSFFSSFLAPFFLLFFFPFCQADCIESMELPADNWLFVLLAQIAGLFTSSIFLSAITADIVVPHHTGTGRATMQTSSTHPSSRIRQSMGSVGREIVIPRIASSPRGPLLREISN